MVLHYVLHTNVYFCHDFVFVSIKTLHIINILFFSRVGFCPRNNESFTIKFAIISDTIHLKIICYVCYS